jgi:hypothetical protein
VAFRYARCTLRHTLHSPYPNLCDRFSVEDTPITHYQCPCVNQVEDVLIFVAFLRPKLSYLIEAHHTFPIDRSLSVSP